MPSILSEVPLLGQMWTAGRGPQEGTGRPPGPQFMGTSGLRLLEGPGILIGENQPKILVANLSLPGLSLGQGTLNPAGVFSQVSWDPYLT
jgi:hypothetical protein